MRFRSAAAVSVLLSLFLSGANSFAQQERSAFFDEGSDGSKGVLSAEAPKEKSGFFSDFSAAFFNFASAPMIQAGQRSAKIESYSYISLDYRIDRKQRISLRPAFNWSTAGTTDRNEYKSGDFRWSDAYLNYKYKHGLVIPATRTELFSTLRVYAPTSEESINRGMIARIRPEFEIENRLSKDFALTFFLEPDYYIQSRTGYVNANNGQFNGNRNYGYESSAELEYRIARWMAAAASFGHKQMWHHTSEANNSRDIFMKEDMTAELGMNFSFGPLFMVAGISQTRDVLRPRNEFALFRDDDSEYYLLTNYNF